MDRIIQPAKKIYESLLGDGVNASALEHILCIRFLRTEGIEAAPKTRIHSWHTMSLKLSKGGKKLFLEQGKTDPCIRGLFNDVVSRYSFMGLWPCSYKDLDYLARQEWLVKNINKKAEKSVLTDGVNDAKTSRTSVKVNYPDTSRMIVYDSRQKQDAALLPNTTELPAASNSILLLLHL
ncbi:hypothetical protein C5167_025681 [Papaver somniferum]|uniref:Uncharacterized protein n=1 Tax=Papaver somniferum TaxID=3469 RepID=A0A4Y7JW58_PAPSO|nr:hypothetical protein C5167_025681 [Papaver somniferum]